MSVLIIIAILWLLYSCYWEWKRRKAFRELAKDLGLTYSPARNYEIPERVGFMKALKKGRKQYAYNLLEGNYKGYPVLVFDYRYLKGRGEQEKSYHFSYFLLKLEKSFPELHIYPENMLTRLGAMVGFSDINFESLEFSRNFSVWSKDKKFAYDICHSRMMECLLQHPKLSMEIAENWIGFGVKQRIKPKHVPENLDLIVEIRSHVPTYLISVAENLEAMEEAARVERPIPPSVSDGDAQQLESH